MTITEKFSPQTITLKNNKTITIRHATIQDAENFLQCTKTYLDHSPFIPLQGKDLNLSIADEKVYIRNFIQSDNSLLLIAQHKGQILGNIDIKGRHIKVLKHTAMLSIGILPEWRNCGLGAALMKAAIDWAKANPILELLYLEVYANHEAGIALYKKFGFQQCGITKDYFKDNGVYYDNMAMSLFVR